MGLARWSSDVKVIIYIASIGSKRVFTVVVSAMVINTHLGRTGDIGVTSSLKNNC